MADLPLHDPTQILDDLRSAALSQLLVAGTTHFDVGTALADGPLDYTALRNHLQLAERPASVLLTGLRSLGLVDVNAENGVELTAYGREKLSPNSEFNLRGYIGLGALGADAQNMLACLRNDAPAGDVSFVYHATGGPSALDEPSTSDALTRAMAARARNVAPHVAQRLDLSSCTRLLDVGGGHGIYALELLKRYPNLTATIVDREPPLRVAREYAAGAGLADRVELVFDDIHTYRSDSNPIGKPHDVVLMANILHDYSHSDARRLVQHFAGQLPPGGMLIVLDAFLDAIPPGAPPISSGPRAVAAYSAMLFSICEGRCYALDEYQAMLRQASLALDPDVHRVPAHGSLLIGRR